VGQRQRALGFTIDGVNAKELFWETEQFDTVMTSSLDMIQEFKMYTTGLPAEYGHSAGGQLSGVMRSGTNQFHGSAEDRYLYGRLVHRQYFEQLRRCRLGRFRTRSFRAILHYHEMSATAGGPIRIPHVYNGKDKTSSSAASSAITKSHGNIYRHVPARDVRRQLQLQRQGLSYLRSEHHASGGWRMDTRSVPTTSFRRTASIPSSRTFWRAYPGSSRTTRARLHEWSTNNLVVPTKGPLLHHAL